MKPQGEPTKEEWRELAKQAAVEQDSNKMIGLVEQLIAKLDEQLSTVTMLGCRPWPKG